MSKKKCPEFENHERWLVSYADMLTLLFAVFVVLYALNVSSSKPTQTNAELAGSLEESFSTPMDEIPVDRRVGPTEAGYGIFENFKGNQVRPTISKKYPGMKERIAVIETEMNRVKKELEERLYGPQKMPDADKPGQARIVDVSRSGKGFKLQLLARHFYKPGEFEVRRDTLPELDKVIVILKELGREITIEGHTDGTKAEGKMSNWELSALRAGWVARYMVNQHNFSSRQVSIAGYGDSRPIVSNGNAEGRSLNRRIEIQVHYDPEFGSEPE
jgi:chemotaxis protein MotB